MKVTSTPSQRVKLDQQFALRLYSSTILRVVDESFAAEYEVQLCAIAQRNPDPNSDYLNCDVQHRAQTWLEAGLLHKTLRRGLLHLIGEDAFWSEIRRDEWQNKENFDAYSFSQYFGSLLTIAELGDIPIQVELLDSFDELSYCLDEGFDVVHDTLTTTTRQLRNWALNNFETVAGYYIDDFANRALHNRQFCQEVSLMCVSALGLLFSPDKSNATYKWTPNKGHPIFKRQRWPTWVQKALSARERGLCASCSVAFSQLTRDSHIDHIVPLAVGGSNDISNLQLLCSACNLAKKTSHQTVSPSFQNYIQVGEKVVPCTFVSPPPNYGGWYHPENIVSAKNQSN
jgi:5-methylcytosine-specific restriction endonuclease McrA